MHAKQKGLRADDAFPLQPLTSQAILSKYIDFLCSLSIKMLTNFTVVLSGIINCGLFFKKCLYIPG